MRLNQFLARAGITSRRKADELIKQGLIQVNGRAVREMGIKIDPSLDRVSVSGKKVELVVDYKYYLVNKPVGVVSTTVRKNQEMPVTELVPRRPRVFPVGRLDKNSEGLILLTNDGELAYKLTHPKFEMIKTYRVLVDRRPTEKELKHLRDGMKLKEGITSPAEITMEAREGKNFWLIISIHQGWNRQVRRMLDVYSLTVRRLVRVKMGSLDLGNLEVGKYRTLTTAEVEALKRVVLK